MSTILVGEIICLYCVCRKGSEVSRPKARDTPTRESQRPEEPRKMISVLKRRVEPEENFTNKQSKEENKKTDVAADKVREGKGASKRELAKETGAKPSKLRDVKGKEEANSTEAKRNDEDAAAAAENIKLSKLYSSETKPKKTDDEELQESSKRAVEDTKTTDTSKRVEDVTGSVKTVDTSEDSTATTKTTESSDAARKTAEAEARALRKIRNKVGCRG